MEHSLFITQYTALLSGRVALAEYVGRCEILFLKEDDYQVGLLIQSPRLSNRGGDEIRVLMGEEYSEECSPKLSDTQSIGWTKISSPFGILVFLLFLLFKEIAPKCGTFTTNREFRPHWVISMWLNPSKYPQYGS